MFRPFGAIIRGSTLKGTWIIYIIKLVYTGQLVIASVRAKMSDVKILC
jgi:hypothetical protein